MSNDQEKMKRLAELYQAINNAQMADLKKMSDDLALKIKDLAEGKKKIKALKTAITALEQNSGPEAAKIKNKQHWGFGEYLERFYKNVKYETREDLKLYALDLFKDEEEEKLKLILAGFRRLDQEVPAKNKDTKPQSKLAQHENDEHGRPTQRENVEQGESAQPENEASGGPAPPGNDAQGRPAQSGSDTQAMQTKPENDA